MAAPYFKDIVIGNVGTTLRELGYSDEAILRCANRLADEWTRLVNAGEEPRTLATDLEVDKAADGSLIEPLRLTFRLMPRSNGEVAGWLVSEAAMDDPTGKSAAQVQAVGPRAEGVRAGRPGPEEPVASRLGASDRPARYEAGVSTQLTMMLNMLGGYSVEQVQAIGNQMADLWEGECRLHPSQDPREVLVRTELEVDAQGEPLAESFVLEAKLKQVGNPVQPLIWVSEAIWEDPLPGDENP